MSEPVDTAPWPLDFALLKKGDSVDAETIERAFGVPRTARNYRFKQLRLREQIHDFFLAAGQALTIKTDGDGLRILEDESASYHNPRVFSQGYSQMRNAFVNNAGVDVGKLSDGRRAVHERTVLQQGRILQGADTARREDPELKPHERKTPGKLGDK